MDVFVINDVFRNPKDVLTTFEHVCARTLTPGDLSVWLDQQAACWTRTIRRRSRTKRTSGPTRCRQGQCRLLAQHAERTSAPGAMPPSRNTPYSGDQCPLLKQHALPVRLPAARACSSPLPYHWTSCVMSRTSSPPASSRSRPTPRSNSQRDWASPTSLTTSTSRKEDMEGEVSMCGSTRQSTRSLAASHGRWRCLETCYSHTPSLAASRRTSAAGQCLWPSVEPTPPFGTDLLEYLGVDASAVAPSSDRT